MTHNEDFHNNIEASQRRLKEGIFAGDNMVAIYTVLRILEKMERSLGLEAKLEYMDTYLKTIEKNNPQIKSAVSRALDLISVEKIYKEAANHGENV